VTAPTPEELLAGPRGRRLVLELARLLLPDQLGPTLFYAAHDLESGAVPPTVTPQDVAAVLARADLPPVEEGQVWAALDSAVTAARYWQEQDGADVLAAEPVVRAALAPVARALVGSGLTHWWSSPLDRSGQCRVTWIDDAGHVTDQPDAMGHVEALARWRAEARGEEARARRERPADPAARWSGVWWSSPPMDLPQTTREIPGRGPVGLRLVEDGRGWRRARVTRVEVPEDAVVLALDSAASWAEVCRRHPLPVTASRRHDWWRTTGRNGEWVQPDWAAVAAEADAVHVSMSAYLTTAGTVVDVEDGVASVMAGMSPDATWWLTTAPAEAAPAREWVWAEDSEEWRPVT
jgi:hypothetical protein